MPTDLLSLTMPCAVELPSSTDIDLRPMASDDTEALARLYLGAYPPEIGAVDLDAAREEMRASFAGDYGELRRDASFIAHLDGGPAGAIMTTMCSIWDEGLEGPFIIDLFADPGFKGRGVGKALVAGVIRACEADDRLSLRVGGGYLSSRLQALRVLRLPASRWLSRVSRPPPSPTAR